MISICHTPAASYAVDVVALWAHAVREAGRLPMYGITWNNVASRRLTGRLELTIYGENFHLL